MRPPLLPLCLLAALPAAALPLPAFGPTAGRIPEAAALDSALSLTWQGIKARNIAPWGKGLVHRPKSEYPGDAVSEGQGYGMLVALLMGDKPAFDSIWDATERSMLVRSGAKASYDWWRCPDGGTACADGPTYRNGPASDADQDIALSLLFADSLVKAGKWLPHASPRDGAGYGVRAQQVLNSLWTDMVEAGRYLRPGSWGGATALNPGYFAPAWYRVFAARDTAAGRDWMGVVDQSYATLAANPGAPRGLAPDWCDGSGKVLSSGPGYNAYARGQWFYKDAVRVPWRLALDWFWFGEPRAKAFLDKGHAFVSDPAAANFFRLDGSVLPDSAPFVFDGGRLSRPRSEHSHLTVGMWGCAAAPQGPAAASAWARELLTFHAPGQAFWGHAADAAGEDTLHNEMYFDQFLAWFGGAVLAGRFANVPEELADADPSLVPAWSLAPTVTPASADFQKEDVLVSGRLNKALPWRVAIAHRDSTDRTWSVSGRSDTVRARWNGKGSDGRPFPQGWCEVTLSARGLPDSRLYAWVSHQRDPRADSAWILVDSCRDSGTPPAFGAWKPFDNLDKGGSSRTVLALSGTGADRGLAARYDLGTGGYQYGGLQWDAQGWTGLAGARRMRYRARADRPTVVDLYVLQSDIQDDWLHVLDTVGTEWRTFEHAFASFTPRLNGGHALSMAKATGLRWHLQADKCLGTSCLAGTLTVGDFVLGGDLAAMATLPAAAVPRPDTLPGKEVIGVVGLRRDRAGMRRVAAFPGGLRLDLPAPATVSVRDLSGRLLSTRRAEAGSQVLPLPGHGLRLVELHGEGWAETRRVALP